MHLLTFCVLSASNAVNSSSGTGTMTYHHSVTVGGLAVTATGSGRTGRRPGRRGPGDDATSAPPDATTAVGPDQAAIKDLSYQYSKSSAHSPGDSRGRAAAGQGQGRRKTAKSGGLDDTLLNF